MKEALDFLRTHHVRTGASMEWFEFGLGESQKAAEVLTFIKANFSHLNAMDKARIGAGDQNKANQGFGLTRFQYKNILGAILLQNGTVSTRSAYENQMDFIHFYITNRLEINALFQQNKLDDFFRNNFQYIAYKERVLRIKVLEEQQKIFFLDEFLDVPMEHIDDSLKIGYYPHEQLPHKKYHYSPDQILLAPEGEKAIYRAFTKHRLVYGPIDFYLPGKNTVSFNVISACGPNLMGTSPADERTYLDNGNLNTLAYTRTCIALADFIVGTAKNQGNTKLIMPAFGMGVYIKNVPIAQRPEAVRIMYQAFAYAAFTFQLSVDWVVWSQEKNSYLQKTYLDQLKGYNSFINNVPHADMLAYAADLVGQGIPCAVLNAGSDRTIGGKFIAQNPTTVEEQLAQKSDLMLLHTVFNLKMIQKFVDSMYSALDFRKYDLTFGQALDSSDDLDCLSSQQDESGSEDELADDLFKNITADRTIHHKPGSVEQIKDPSGIELVNIPTISELKFYRKQQNVEVILSQFKKKIDAIGAHKPQSKTVALTLLTDLQKLTQATFANPVHDSNLLINAAIPALQRDLGWGDYLANMAKSLINALTYGFSLGTHHGFFEIKSSDAAQYAKQLDYDLESAVALKS